MAAADVQPRVDVHLDGDLDHLGPLLEATLFRLAQEGVTNARRHARNATEIRVVLTGYGDRVELMVADDGDAVRGDPEVGFGLTGLRERTRSLGGTFDARPAEARGWRIDALLPVEAVS